VEKQAMRTKTKKKPEALPLKRFEGPGTVAGVDKRQKDKTPRNLKGFQVSYSNNKKKEVKYRGKKERGKGAVGGCGSKTKVPRGGGLSGR